MEAAALKQAIPLDIYGLKLAATCEEPGLAEELQNVLRLFLQPQVQPNCWQLTLAPLNGNGRARNAFHAVPSDDARILVDEAIGRVLLDREARVIEAQIAPGLPGLAAMLVPILNILQRSDIFVLHSAGFLDHKGKGFLFPGCHSSGKTTLALTALELGCKIVADDILLLEKEGMDICLLPLLSVLSLEEGNSAKTMFNVLDHYPREVFQRIANPGFILFPKITEQAVTTVEAIPSRKEAFDQLLTHSLFAEEKSNQAAQLRVLWELAGKTSAYRLFLGRDHRHSPGMLHELLDQLEVVNYDDRSRTDQHV